MASNVGMYDACIPAALTDEQFMLIRPGVAFQVKVEGMSSLSANEGVLYLTTKRLLFVTDASKRVHKDGFTFINFEIPLKHLQQENYNQPIFGANYLSGVVDAIPGKDLNKPSYFKLWFMTGGSGSFLPFFFRALSEARIPVALPLAQLIASGVFTAQFNAVADPSDPSLLYIDNRT